MIKVSKLSDYAVVVLEALTRQAEQLSNAGHLAEKTRLPEPTVAKVLKLLARGEIVESVRGAGGGYRLARPAHAITVADVIESIEGPVAMTACVEGGHEGCDFHAHCMVKGRWDEVNSVIRNALEGITLAEMMIPRAAKNEVVFHERL